MAVRFNWQDVKVKHKMVDGDLVFASKVLLRAG